MIAIWFSWYFFIGSFLTCSARPGIWSARGYSISLYLLIISTFRRNGGVPFDTHPNLGFLTDVVLFFLIFSFEFNAVNIISIYDYITIYGLQWGKRNKSHQKKSRSESEAIPRITKRRTYSPWRSVCAHCSHFLHRAWFNVLSLFFFFLLFIHSRPRPLFGWKFWWQRAMPSWPLRPDSIRAPPFFIVRKWNVVEEKQRASFVTHFLRNQNEKG